MTAYQQMDADRAAFAPALQNSYNSQVVKSDDKFRGGKLPAALPHISDLNFLDPDNNLFHTDLALVSFGQFIGGSMPHGMMQGRDRSRTTIIGDSGGYQLAKGVRRWQGDLTRRAALQWLEVNVDVGMTLDIPTMAIGRPGTAFPDFAACLEPSLGSLRYFAEHRRGRAKFLSVLQGRTVEESDTWYDKVKELPFDGWAFAGALRLDFHQVCRRLIQMADSGLLGGRQNYIHFLGTARLNAAVCFTALQRALRRHVDASIRVTFDAASPSLLAANYKAILHPELIASRFVYGVAKVPRSADYVGHPTPFPFKTSTIGRKSTIGDFCFDQSAVRQSSFDVLSDLMLTNHNLESLLAALSAANSVIDFVGQDREEFTPVALLRAVDAIGRVFESNTGRRLSANRRRLEMAIDSGDGTAIGGERENWP